MSKSSRIGSDPLDDLIPGQRTKPPGRPSTVDRRRSTGKPKARPATTTKKKPPAAVGSWNATHERVTFHCPRAVIDAVEAEVTRSSRSKSRVIVDALREHLKLR